MTPIHWPVEKELTDDCVIPLFKGPKCNGYGYGHGICVYPCWTACGAEDHQPYGFQWKAGNSVSIKIDYRYPIGVPEQSIISYTKGEHPTLDTHGDFIGQRFYNLVDVKSWELVSYLPNDDDYLWNEDKNLVYQVNSDCKFDVEPDMEGKQVRVTLCNFRREVIKEDVFEGQNQFYWTLSPEQSKDIKQGIYYLYTYTETSDGAQQTLDRVYEIHIL